jgi:zinc transport system substrate-binding protein
MKKIFLVLLLFFSCSKKEENHSVLVTIPPYAYFVERITQGRLPVEILVPPGANPHIYEPSPKQVKDILGVKVWFQTGELLEKKVLAVLKEYNPQIRTVDLSEGFALLGHEECHHHHCEESHDIHLWMSPKLAQQQARKIAEALIQTFPQEKATFEEGLSSLLRDLEALDQAIGARLKPYAGEAILVSHPAFSYYCQEYGLIQLSVESEGKDPLPQDIARVLEEVQAHPVRVVLTQAQYNNKGAVLIAEKLGLPVHAFDPYSADYVKNLNHLTQLIAHD